MKIEILYKKVLENISSEEELLGTSTLESIYEIRKLKALAHSLAEGGLFVDAQINEHGQIFIDKYEIWLNSNEWIRV